MTITEITDISLPELAPYRRLTSPRRQGSHLIIAESAKVIERALDAGLRPVSLLCEKRHIEGDAAEIIRKAGDIPVYTASREVLAGLTGYELTKGVLCAMRRPDLPTPDELLRDSRRICVIYDVCEATNIGVIFRTAAALGYDGILVTGRSCDPFSRRAIRVSMGATFQIPWTFADATTPLSNTPSTLADPYTLSDSGTHSSSTSPDPVIPLLDAYGFQSISMALTDNSVSLEALMVEPDRRYALLLGSEGYGLPAAVIASTTHVVRIPMSHGVDSLNVGAAAAIALWHFRPHS